MDLSNIKIDLLDPNELYLFTIPVEWLTDTRIQDFADVLKSKSIKGVILGGEVTNSKLIEVFKNASDERKEELLQALGYFHVNPLEKEQTK